MTTREVHEHHRRTPSALAFMARALAPSPGLGRDGAMPRIGLTWSPVRVASKHLAGFHRATGLPNEAGISILYPQVLGFPLVMALLTHRSYPLPIRHALQIRNRLVRHRDRFGAAGTAGPRSAAPALAQSTVTQRFEIARGGGQGTRAVGHPPNCEPV